MVHCMPLSYWARHYIYMLPDLANTESKLFGGTVIVRYALTVASISKAESRCTTARS